MKAGRLRWNPEEPGIHRPGKTKGSEANLQALDFLVLLTGIELVTY